jgi:hypothetical protein
VELITKNIILYDEFGGVSGFAEFKIRANKTDIKVRHNLGVDASQFSVVTNGELANVFKIFGASSNFELHDRVDFEKEIFVCVKGGEATLASGVINQGVVERREVVVKEVDEVLRKACVIDEEGRGQCESCPYREYFFGAVADGEEVVV